MTRSGCRSVLKGLLVATGVGTLGVAGYREAPIWLADLRTATGEVRQQTLADGSQLYLDTATAVDVRFTTSRRQLVLRAGELLVDTARDPRPFSVVTAEGSLRALGTRFAVRQYSGYSRLSVFEHAVALTPRATGEELAACPAGQALTFDERGVLQHTLAAPTEDAWTHGRLVVDGWSLRQLLTELQRYRIGYLSCTDEVASLRVSGAYSLRDLDLTLAALGRALGLQVERYGPLWTSLHV